MLDNMSNHDATKWDYFLNLNVCRALRTAMFYKEKEDLID
jgi:hypothetical protein